MQEDMQINNASAATGVVLVVATAPVPAATSDAADGGSFASTSGEA